MLRGSEEETDTVTQQLTEHTRKASDEFNAQAAKIDALEAQIHDENLSNSKKIELIEQMKAIIPGYNAELSKEGKIINENTAAITAYLTQLEKQIKLKAAQEDLEAAYKKKRQLEKQQKKQERMLRMLIHQERHYITTLVLSFLHLSWEPRNLVLHIAN